MLGPRLELRQSQSLVMTPMLRQAIQLLQFSNLEVAEFVEAELEKNPLLERDESADAAGEVPAAVQPETPPDVATADSADLVATPTLPEDAAAPLDVVYDGYEAHGPADGIAAGTPDDDRPFEDRVEARRSLRDHIGEQIRLTFTDPTERLIAAHLLALLDPAGRLAAEPETIATALLCPVERVDSVRRRMMQFDPTGLFARSLAECLGAQLAEKNRLDPAMRAMLDNLDCLARRDFRALCTICGVDMEDVRDMAAEIRMLDPKPGAAWNEAALPAVVPDVLMRLAPGGDWLLELNPETLPRVLVNTAYAVRVERSAGREAKTFLADRMASANWLVRSLQQRAQTILKVCSEIVRVQESFFREGVTHLRPLTLREVAEAVGLHESTVSRVTSNKYLATPRGVLELKYFFTNAIAGAAGAESHSAAAIRARIRAMIGAERPDDILSDDAIVATLRREGVDIARRTVAKYREALHIPSSVQRKREKVLQA